MADNSTSSKATTEQVKLVLTVVSTFGLSSILLVIIGRLWTIAYFDHFGLSAADLEFSIEDFAFRSLEVLISLGLAGLGLLLAWRAKSLLETAGNWWLVGELAAVTAGAALMLLGGLGWLVNQWPWLATTTGVLGVISGIVLIVMILLVADIWFGSGDDEGGDEKFRRHQEDLGALGADIWIASGEVRQAPPHQGKRGTLWAVIDRLKGNWHKLLAGSVMTAIVFLYLPMVTEELATIQAEIDLEEGRLPAAILESVKDPLPSAIASTADQTRSVPVRVILTQSQNTYVLHSTDCTTIGGLDVPITVEGFLPREAPDVCKVFTIPTARLKSIEYFRAPRKVPSNESLLYPIEVGLGEEPLEESFSSAGASDEEALVCAMESQGATGAEGGMQEPVRFYNSIWYEFTPATNGAVLTRVEAGEFMPVIGIWQAPEDATDVQRVPGSGDDGSACESEAKEITIEELADGSGSNVKKQTKNVVGVVANVQAGTRYVVSVGALENEGGTGSVSFEFRPGGYFFNPAIPEAQAQAPEVERRPPPGEAALGETKGPADGDLVSQAQALVPQVEVVSGVGATTLEVWGLNPKTYELQPLADIPKEDRTEVLGGNFTGTEFGMKSGKEQLDFVEEAGEDEEQPPTFSARGLTQGIWKLVVPEDFVGLTRVSATVHPDLNLAFADTSKSPLRDPCVQRAVLLVLNESDIRDELGYEGNVIFDPASLDEDCQISEPVEDATTSARQLLEEAGVAEEEAFPIQIQVEEERETLLAAADVVLQRLLEIGLDAAIEPCVDACITVFFEKE